MFIGKASQVDSILAGGFSNEVTATKEQVSPKASFFARKMEWLFGSVSAKSSLGASSLQKPSFFSSSTIATDSTSLSDHSISSLSSDCSKGEIEKNEALFSVAGFKTMASKRLVAGFSSRTRIILQLRSYHQQAPTLSKSDKIDRLESLHKTVEAYYQNKINVLNELSAGSSERNNVTKNIQAARFLLNGIALEKQKLLSEGSYYQPHNEFGTEDTTASGGMATLSVVLYFPPPSLGNEGEVTRDTPVGYFKPTGTDRMASTVAKELGIPEVSTAVANLSGRAVASYQISKLLEFSDSSSGTSCLVPETSFAFHENQYGSVQLRAEGDHIATEEKQEQFIPSDQKSHYQVVVDVARGGLRLREGEKLELRNAVLTLNANDQVCEHGKPISGLRASELVERGDLFLKPEIVSRFLQNDLDDSILETLRGETALTMKDLAVKDPALTIQGDEIYEKGEPITLERAAELVGEKKIVRVKSMITSVADIDFKNPRLQQEMSEAHLFDLLTGQIDRHAGNFIYEKEQGDWHVKLIDNDLSFPANLDHIDNGAVSVLARSPIPKLLPRLVSRRAAEKIALITADDIKETLSSSGLSKEEIHATIQRLEALQVYLRELPSKGGKIVDQWNDETYGELMKAEDNYIYQGQKSQNLAKESMEAATLLKQ